MDPTEGRDMPPAPAAPEPLSALSDERLDARLRALAWGERHALVSFLRHLQEFDRREAYAPLGCSSLFDYCVSRLGLSEDETYRRIQVARLARRFPQALELLAAGETHLSCLSRVSPHITAGNAASLLAEIRGKSKREVERITARFEGPGPRRDSVRFLPSAEADPGADAGPDSGRLPFGCAAAARGDASRAAQGASPAAQEIPAPAPDTSPAAADIPTAAQDTPPTTRHAPPSRPVACAAPPAPAREPPRRVRVSFTAGEGLWVKIERARALLRHKVPSGRLEALMDAAFESLLAACDPDRRRPARRPPDAASPGRRRIPRWVKDIVWRRDGGRCTFVASDGRRCQAVAWLEYDHVLPFALGGTSSEPENVRLLCRAHNRHAAREAFGSGAMTRRRSGLP